MPLQEDRVKAKPHYLQEWGEEIEGLTTLLIQNKRGCEPDVVVVFLHGYGSNPIRTKKIAETVLNYSFLPPTSRFLQLSRDVPTVRFLIPQAPHPVSDGVYGWWKMPNVGLLASLVLTGTGQLEGYRPEAQLQECRTLLHRYLHAVQNTHPTALLVLGGFSQGSLLVSDLLLTRSYYRQPDITLLMSSTLMERDKWMAAASPLFHTYLIQTHGVYDPVLAYREAQSFYELLSCLNAGESVFFPFEGGHDMSLKARQFVASSLETYLSQHWTPSSPHP